MRRLLAGAMLAVAGLLAVPALAADHTITAGPVPNTYEGSPSPDNVTIDQGDTITFKNDDQAMHNVTEDTQTEGRSGDPRFQSDTIGNGKSAVVKGVEFLTTGDYAFYCTIHPFMKGTLHVTANGTPKTAPPPDTTPPNATVAISDSRISVILKHKSLKVRLASDEPARFKLTATSGKTTIAKGTATTTDGSRSAAIALTKAGKKLLAKSKKLTVKLTASVNDEAGNRSAASATRKLRR